MNMKLSAVVFGVLLALSAGQAFADSTPTTQCIPSLGLCTFSNLQPYNNGTGQATYYYCTPSSPTQSVYMENHSVMIGGFQSDGTLTDPGSVISQYAFAAYLDPTKANAGLVQVKDANSGTPIACYTGTDGRPIMPGQPNLP